MNSDELKSRNPDFVNSLANGLDVLTTFDGEHSSLSISEVAARTHLTRASARRILLTLAELGFVLQSGTLFSLSPRSLSIGHSYLSSSGLGDAIAPRIAELSSALHESVSAAVLDGEEIVYIARSSATKIMQVRISIGTRLPAAITSMGRVLLAGLDDSQVDKILRTSKLAARTPNTKTSPKELLEEIRRVRIQGYSVVNQELEIGLKSVAVPIKNKRSEFVAAINVAGVATIESQNFEPRILEALLDCASKIAADMPNR